MSQPAPSFASMRRAATGLLIAMTGLYLLVNWVGGDSVASGYVKAFAEAAMVGGLADWFAVTAIFRRPFGLPIPHTAVIPKNQGRIADALGSFIAENFLSPDLVAARVAQLDLALVLGRWLADEERTARLADGLVSAIPPLLDTLDDETVADFLRRQAEGRIHGERLAPAVGSILETLMAQGRHQVLLDAGLGELWRWLEANNEAIRGKISARSGWFLRLLTIDSRASDAVIGAAEDLIHDATRDPNHPLRLRVTAIAEKFAEDLRTDPALHAKIEGMVKEVFQHPSVHEALDAAWIEIKEALRRDCASPNSQIRASAVEALKRIGEGLQEDESVRAALNERLRALLVELAARHGVDVSRLVSETIRGWDADTVVEKLEANVGRDLQYIRLNGTIIGGLVGLALHGGAELLALLG